MTGWGSRPEVDGCRCAVTILSECTVSCVFSCIVLLMCCLGVVWRSFLMLSQLRDSLNPGHCFLIVLNS